MEDADNLSSIKVTIFLKKAMLELLENVGCGLVASMSMEHQAQKMDKARGGNAEVCGI